MHNPANRQEHVGSYYKTNELLVEHVCDAAEQAQFAWQCVDVKQRAGLFTKAADLLEARTEQFMYLAVKEAGKTWQDAIDEVREAVDFLRWVTHTVRCMIYVRRLCQGQPASIMN